MRRREFLAIVGGATVAWPHFARAQQQARSMRRLGILLYSSPQEDPQIKVLPESFHELGYIEGYNLSLENGFAEPNLERLPRLPRELVGVKTTGLFPISVALAPRYTQATLSVPI